jgi:hypothetical protein
MTAAVKFRVHANKRDENEKYLFVYGRGDLDIFNTAGAAATVTVSADAASYLASGDPTADDLRLVSIADYTLMLNTLVTCSVVQTITSSFTVTENFDTYTKMTSRLPTANQYFRTLADDGIHLSGYWQYILTAANNGFASWKRDTAVHQAWKNVGGAWDNAGRNPMGFRIRFKRAAAAHEVLVYDATGGTVEHMLTLSGAFTNYTFDVGDEIHITDAGDDSLPEGWYPIGSRVGNNSIGLSDNGSSGVNYRNSSDVTATYADSSGDKSDSDSDYISVSGACEENFFSAGATDMDDIAERLQVNLRTANGLEDVIIYWDADNGWMRVISPFRGTAATVVNIYDPDGSVKSIADGTGEAFDFSSGTATAGAGSPTTDTDLIEERWEQVAAPGSGSAKIDATTMPVQVTRTTVSPLAFKVDTIDWVDRLSGDEDSNPAPSIFVDKDGDAASIKLSDISFHRNRLVLAGDENIVFSQDGDFFNLFQTDSSQVIDSDPIDRALSGPSVTLIDFVVPYRKTLVIFTKNRQQWELNAPESLTPSTAAITPTTTKDSTPDVRPMVLNDSIFFTGPDGLRSKMFDYRFLDTTGTADAMDVSSHVKQLISVNAKTIAIHANTSTVFVLAEECSVLYIYRQLKEGPRLLQSAWGKWVFHENMQVDDIAVIDDELYILYFDTAEGKRTFESIDISESVVSLDNAACEALPTPSCS